MKLAKRIVSSVAAIAAVCVIFGAKAMEAERRAETPTMAVPAANTSPASASTREAR